MIKYKNSELGRSMVEMMGYLAIMMTVVIAMGKIVSAVFDNHRYSTATLQLTELATSMVKAAAIDVDYRCVLANFNAGNVDDTTEDSEEETADECTNFRCTTAESGNGYVHNGLTANGDAMHLLPPSFRIAGKKIFHVFGGEVGICESPIEDENGARYDQFSITFTRLSKKQCVEMAMQNWKSNQYIDLYAMSINGQYWWFWNAYGDEKGQALSVEDEEGEASSVQEGGCSSNVCSFPVKRSILTGVSSAGQCLDSDDNTITWVFN